VHNADSALATRPIAASSEARDGAVCAMLAGVATANDAQDDWLALGVTLDLLTAREGTVETTGDSGHRLRQIPISA